MNVIIPHNLFDTHKILFKKPVENKIKCYNYFYRILYNDTFFTSRNIILSLPLYFVTTHYNNNVYHISFSNELLNSLLHIETDILNNINNITNKTMERLLFNELNHKRYVFHLNKQPELLLLRISGIWESREKIGITYKWIHH